MRSDQELSRYQQALVQELLDQSNRRETEAPGSIQVFFDSKSVGIVECEERSRAEKVFEFDSTRGLLELRSSSGLAIGMLPIESFKPVSAKFLSGHYRIEMNVTPQEDTSVLRLTSTNLLAMPREASDHGPAISDSQFIQNDTSSWSKVALAAQVLLAAGVVFLVADRFSPMTNGPGQKGQHVAVSDQQFQQVLQQLAALESRLASNPVVSVENTSGTVLHDDLGMNIVSQPGQNPLSTDSVLEKKAVSFEKGLLERRPVWVRFKKGVEDIRRNNFFKEVSAHEHTQIGGWYSFNLEMPKSEKPTDILGAFSQRDDIEIITTEVVTRRVQVRFKKDSKVDDINGFFDEIRIPKSEPKDNWYNLNLSLPEPVEPKSFINELRSRGIVEQVKIDLDDLPSF
ncbi:MAG: hypothetical protein NPIRA04_06480 [Nitrospirales bacterium]|nr:MAG: hypothetical protein NPIRA04_06480 [Nitrospirales bacterium]